jgi:hypothetical protein
MGGQETRNSKVEIRRKSEIRNPKVEGNPKFEIRGCPCQNRNAGRNMAGETWLDGLSTSDLCAFGGLANRLQVAKESKWAT